MTGIIEAETLRSEQYELEARTSDPSGAEPGEYWIRTDLTGSSPNTIGELRRQDNSGVTGIQIFDSSEEANLGSNVVRGPSVVLDNGDVGFVAMVKKSVAAGNIGSPRAINASGAEYLSHNKLTLPIIPNSGVARWTFNDNDTQSRTAIDVWNGNNGTINGATTSASGANQNYTTNEAYSFDGSNDWIDVPNNFNLFDGSSDVSFGAWVNVPSGADTSVDGQIFSWFQYDLEMFAYNGGNSTLTGNKPATAIYDGNWHTVEAGSDISGDGWTHIFTTWSQTNGMTLYINGSSVDSNNFTGTPGSKNQENSIGGNPGRSEHINAELDDVRLYNKALNSTEMSNLYNTGSI